MVTVNTSDLEIIRARQELATSFGGVLDAKRPTAWIQYGYRETLTFADFLNAYERGGAGHGAVHRILDGCWQELPRIKTPETDKPSQWEKKVGAILKAINAWGKLKDFDRRNLVGRYSALIYRVADGKQLSEPLERASRLVDIVPLYEDQIKVQAWNSDEQSEDYGKPAMFQYRTRQIDGQDTQGKPMDWIDVHPSRVQILAEGAVDGDFFHGVPLLKAGFNHLADIEKISGGSGESFLKNSARVISFEYDPTGTPTAMGENGEKTSVRAAHEEQVQRLNKNIDSAIVMQGAKAGVLQTSISDPSKPFEVAANLFASSVRLPFTIVFGQQTGRLASDEDQADAVKRYKTRQQFEITPALTEFVTRMQACGIFDEGEFEIEWPDIAAPSDGEKLDRAVKMEAINTAGFNAGQGEVFLVDEVRKMAGYEPLAAPIMSEGDPKEDDEDPDSKAATKPTLKD